MSKMASCGRQYDPHTANFECQGKKFLHIFIKSDSCVVVDGKMLQLFAFCFRNGNGQGCQRFLKEGVV